MNIEEIKAKQQELFKKFTAGEITDDEYQTQNGDLMQQLQEAAANAGAEQGAQRGKTMALVEANVDRMKQSHAALAKKIYGKDGEKPRNLEAVKSAINMKINQQIKAELDSGRAATTDQATISVMMGLNEEKLAEITGAVEQEFADDGVKPAKAKADDGGKEPSNAGDISALKEGDPHSGGDGAGEGEDSSMKKEDVDIIDKFLDSQGDTYSEENMMALANLAQRVANEEGKESGIVIMPEGGSTVSQLPV